MTPHRPPNLVRLARAATRKVSKSLAWRPKVVDEGRGNSVQLGRNGTFRGSRIVFRGDRNTVIVGEGVALEKTRILMQGSGLRLLLEPGVTVTLGCELLLRDEGSTIRIGQGTSIESARFACLGGKSIRVGRDCMVAYDVDVRNSDSHSIVEAEDPTKRLNPEADVVIGDHVWLGARCAVLRGTVIGSHSVVGLGAVVKGKFPSHRVLAGIPARIVRSGVSWDRERL